jgi:outer membrane receptor protein involved in Fe transport
MKQARGPLSVVWPRTIVWAGLLGVALHGSAQERAVLPSEEDGSYQQGAQIETTACTRDNACELQRLQMPLLNEVEPIMDPVEVWGQRRPNDPGAISVLVGDLIEETLADRPAEILNKAPGVNIQMNSGQEHLISIRSPVLTGGAGQGSFLILENGVPTRSPAFGNVNSLIEPHLEIAEAIEIIRGPGSARYGSNAVHGLINIILPERNNRDQLIFAFGSLGKSRADLSERFGQWRVSASIHDESGWRDDTGSEQQKFSAQTEFTRGMWTFTPWLSASSLAQETAGFIQGPKAYESKDLSLTNPNPEAFRDAWSARMAMKAERKDAERTLTVTPFLRTQAMIFSQHFLPYGGVEKNGHTGGGVMAELGHEGEKYAWRLGADADLATGYLKEIQPLPNANPAFVQGQHYDFEVDTKALALWGEVTLTLMDQLNLAAGLRAETHDYDYHTRLAPGIRGRFNVTADRSDSFDLLTPKLGIIYLMEKGALYANYARGERAPQVSDLYRLQNLQRPGQIRTETLDSLELGYRGSLTDTVEIDAAVYAMEKQNFFFRDSDGLNVPNGSTKHFGAELAGVWNINEDLTLTGNVAWSDQTYTFNRPVRAGAEVIRDGAQIDTAPEWLADLSLAWSPIEALDLQISAEHAGEYFTNPANTASYPGHTVLSARMAWRISSNHEAFVSVRNITDARYADRADFAFGNDRYFPGEPLSATFGFRIRTN